MHHIAPLRNDRLCVGIDLHKDTLTAAIFNPCTGEVTFQKFACKCRTKIVEFFTTLPRPHTVAIEAVGFYRWLWDTLEPIVDELLLADATQCRALAGRRIKTDREDAANVAELLAAGRLPVAYAPPAPIAELRHWTRHRHHLSQQHARVLHRVKSLMNLCNRPGPARLKAPGLIRYLKGQRSKLSSAIVMQLEMAIDELVLLERQLDVIAIKLKTLLQQKRFVAEATRLMSFPGVGIIIAATILAEVGDFARFIHRNAIARYAGFNPSVYASGESCRTGHIAKAGSRDLRWAMVQAAWVAIRSDPMIKKLWLKLKRRSDGKRAAIAIARRMLRWMWHTSKNGTMYQRAIA